MAQIRDTVIWLTEVTDRPHMAGRKRSNEKTVMMNTNTAKPDFKERMVSLQKEANKIGPVDPKFDQKTFSDDL